MFALLSLHAAWLAALVFVLVATAGGIAFDGYSHLRHPLALLGVSGAPHAVWFNTLGWGLAGLLLAWQSVAFRERLPAGVAWPARIGAWLLLMSAAAFAAQGLWPLDPSDLDGPASQRHAVCWMLWWIAFVSGAALLSAGLWRERGMRTGAISLMTLAVVVAFLVVMPVVMPEPLAQRSAIAAWFVAYFVCGRIVTRPRQ
jgi:hypothetical protein